MKNLSNKISSFAVSLILGAIIIAFVLTGYQGFQSNTGEVGSVDGTPITSQEFNRRLNQELARFSQFNKGKSLTQKQIRDFRIRERVMDGLVKQKMFLNYATKLHFSAGKLAIKEEIKDLPYFQTNEKFDVNKYKLLLRNNRVSPKEFEEQIIDQIKTQKLAQLLDSVTVSQAQILEMLKYEKSELKVSYAQFAKEDMVKNLPVSKSELSKFVNDKTNEEMLKSLYKTYEATAKAKKEKVVSFNKKKEELAREHLQRLNRDELTKFNNELAEQIKSAMKNGKTSKLKSLGKKYNLDVETKHSLNLNKLAIKSVDLSQDKVLELVKAKDTKNLIVEDTPTHMTIVKINKVDIKDEFKKEEVDKMATSANRALSYNLNDAIINFQEENSKILTSSNLFL